ncbi:hypothetical protein [Psychroflexus torquis]|uniref:hypothetical protein n=1 Tax=Psychroflexus torquis TaxID=57029 RepID=UPI0000D53D17|nr:hypothetical protein [Psychroflexus torquis]
MEWETSLRHILSALGHNSFKAAEIYTRVLAMNKSPLDTMYESVSLDENKTTS